MDKVEGFRPQWTSAPGDTILDLLREKSISVSEFSDKLGIPVAELNQLLDGKSAITLAIAKHLEEMLGASADFWVKRESQFRKDLERQEREWLAELPISDMMRFGWIARSKSAAEKKDACLEFFDVSNFTDWRRRYSQVLEASAFRTSNTYQSRPASVATWLRAGEIAGKEIQCASWSVDKLKSIIPTLRSLTRKKDPLDFIPEIQRLCASCGVAVVIIRAPDGCRASGATRFLDEEQALLMLSVRHLSNDHLWFTLFHEIGHLILHGKDSLFLEGIGTKLMPDKEEDANKFSTEILIPPEHEEALLNLSPTRRDVIRFARALRIPSGIVVGQLQHRKRIHHSKLNGLKRWYTWDVWPTNREKE